ncbi:MAG TPA: FAD binding domain-containing protein [Gaiellaceae bacterium]|nr:FAD binding domain-containing protein [Gaiellaceae bacterium]
MKPAPFEYDAPTSVDEALDLLAQHGDDAKVLAGGQSLVPLLNFRLARPARLVDVNRVGALAHVRRTQGWLRVGALTRMATLERSQLVADHWPILVEAVRYAGHPQIRSRGTVGGSVAHADPAAELPTVLTALDARFRVRSAAAPRTLTAAELFAGFLTTTLAPDELLLEIEVPRLPPGAGTAFVEYARVHGDFALAGAAVTVSGGAAAVALLGAAATPLRAVAAERALAEGADARETAELAAADADLPPARRVLLRDVVRRAVVLARERAS